VTASDGSTQGPAEHAADPAAAVRSVAHLAMDLFVYAPAGALLTAAADMPAMAAKGRARIDQELRNAHVVGRFVVDTGVRRVRGQVERLAREHPGSQSGAGTPTAGAPTPGAAARPSTRPMTRAATQHATTGPTSPGAPGAPTPQRGAPAARDTAVDRAIPDYDTLSASQVVRRLDGLGPGELAAVFRYESTTRGRRTILHRAQQLLGPGGATPPARGS
jgi:hypothetical protein